MSEYTTEVLIFEANDAFRDDLELPTPAFGVALKAEGAHPPVYYGKQIGGSGTCGYIFLNWDSYDRHKELIDGPSYPDVVAGLKPALAADPKPEMYHVKFSTSTAALDKPVTEVLILTLKTAQNRQDVVDILSNFSKASENAIAFGQTREDENKYILIGGWPSVEAHSETAAKPGVAEALEKLFSLADKNHYAHTKLSQYRL